MRLALAITATLALFAQSANAGVDTPTNDLVRVVSGKYVLDEVSVCKLKPRFAAPASTEQPPRFQLRIHSEAPRYGVVSRDKFVLYTAMIELQFRLRLLDAAKGIPPSQVLDLLDCEIIGAPIGTPDIELNTTMTADGIQVEWVDGTTGKAERVTTLWEDL